MWILCRSFSSVAQPTADSSHSDFAPKVKSAAAPASSAAAAAPSAASAQIAADVASHEVFLFMKGTPDAPRCGFSANVVKILRAYPSVRFGSRDVLADESVREAIKQFSDWPTLPQLFIRGEFV